MTDGCSCIYVGEPDYGPEFFSATEPKARKAHACGECGRQIQPGERYEYVCGKWDGDMLTYKTCVDCLSIRNAFFCEAYTFGDIWSRVRDHFSEGASVKPECVVELTPAAAAKLRVVVDALGLRGL